ncbi:nodal homolog 3-A-like [Engystomops pustulosus]|uniref:nodal homolog 3-A-like n=1 Tax=Engystomops pustulosus TaxID=76066 RepID=UPI003AFB6FEE
MSSLKITMKISIFYMFISMLSGRPVHLPRVPPRTHGHHHGVKIPLYMMNLYHTLVGNHKENHKPGTQILEESDTVQSLTAKNFIVEDNRWLLTFDLSTISRKDELRMVELQVHLPPFTKPGNVTLDIYHLNNNSENKLFLGSVTTNIPKELNSSWATFNVTKMIEQSLLWRHKLTNHGEESIQSEYMSGHEYSRKMEKRDVSLQEISKDQAIIVFFIKHKPFSKPEAPSLIKKLAVNTMKMVAFRRHKRTKSENQLSTSGNTLPTLPIEAEEHNPTYRKVERILDSKEVFPKHKFHSSLRGPLMLY